TTERVMVREQCRENANLERRPFPEHIAEHAPHVATTQGKEALVTLLNNSIDESMQVVRQFGEEGLKQDTRHFDGSTLSKFSFVCDVARNVSSRTDCLMRKNAGNRTGVNAEF